LLSGLTGTTNGPREEALCIDLNCDMGEGMEAEAAIFPFISSANIACGVHAGDETTMRRTIEWALEYDIAIGAHPSYPDRANFGRIDMLDSAPGKGDHSLRYDELADILREQLHHLQKICQEFGTALRHVKPHGALYNRAAKDPAVSDLICRAIAGFDPSLLLYGLSGSAMKRAADQNGLSFISEVFADRTYRPDGSLTPRTEPGALIEDPELASAQVLKMVREGRVAVADPFSQGTQLTEGSSNEIPIRAETICIHSDGSHAVEFARLIYNKLKEQGIRINACV
jgi:UPF0271 protein